MFAGAEETSSSCSDPAELLGIPPPCCSCRGIGPCQPGWFPTHSALLSVQHQRQRARLMHIMTHKLHLQSVLLLARLMGTCSKSAVPQCMHLPVKQRCIELVRVNFALVLLPLRSGSNCAAASHHCTDLDTRSVYVTQEEASNTPWRFPE